MAGSKDKRLEPDERGYYYKRKVHRYGRHYPEYHEPSAGLLFELIYTYDVTAACIARELAKQGLSLSAFNALMILYRSDNKGCPLHELSDLLLSSRANITGLIDSLEKIGYAARAAGQCDRRVCFAMITKAGEAFLKSFLPMHYTRVREMCSGLTNKDKGALSDLLTKMRMSVRGLPAKEFRKGKGKK